MRCNWQRGGRERRPGVHATLPQVPRQQEERSPVAQGGLAVVKRPPWRPFGPPGETPLTASQRLVARDIDARQEPAALSATSAGGAHGPARACAAVAALTIRSPAATRALRLSSASTHGTRVSLATQKTAGQRLRVVTRRVGGQGAHTSSFSSCSWRHSRAVPAATIALHTTSCCTTKLTALSSTLAWRPTKEAGGHGRRRVLVCGRPGSPTTSGAELQLFGRAATPSPRAPGARQVHWSTCVRAAIARWKQLRRAADRVCPPRWQRPKERVCVAEQVAASLAERSAMAA